MSFFESFFQTNNIVNTLSEKIGITTLLDKINVNTKYCDNKSNCIFDTFDTFDTFNNCDFINTQDETFYDIKYTYTINANSLPIINLSNPIYPQQYNTNTYDKLLETIKIFDISTYRNSMQENMFKINDKQPFNFHKTNNMQNKYNVVYCLQTNKEILDLVVD